MIVALWRWCNSCRAAMDVQTLRGRTTSVLRYRLIRRDLLGDGALSLPLRQWRHGRTCGPRRDRRLGLLVAAAKPDIGKSLQQRQARLLRMILLGLAAGVADLCLSRLRKLLE